MLRNHVICEDLDRCLLNVSNNTTTAIAISRSHALNNPLGLTDDDIFCFPASDDIVIYSTVMMFRKFHHLLPIINEKIRSISESGLLGKWRKDSDGGIMENERENSASAQGSSQMKLRLEHVEGAFLVVVIGLGIASVAFALEWIVYWLVHSKKIPHSVKNGGKLFLPCLINVLY